MENGRPLKEEIPNRVHNKLLHHYSVVHHNYTLFMFALVIIIIIIIETLQHQT